jgi:hypothetical protein
MECVGGTIAKAIWNLTRSAAQLGPRHDVKIQSTCWGTKHGDNGRVLGRESGCMCHGSGRTGTCAADALRRPPCQASTVQLPAPLPSTPDPIAIGAIPHGGHTAEMGVRRGPSSHPISLPLCYQREDNKAALHRPGALAPERPDL